MKYIITPQAQVVTEEDYHSGNCPDSAKHIARRVFGRVKPEKLKAFATHLKDDFPRK
jgi:hypothetical protein